MPSNQGAVGVQNNPDSSSLITVRMGKQGEQLVSELHARYYEQTYRKNTFSVATSAGQTTTVGVATTYVGLCLSNPLGSPVNLVLTKAGYTFLVAFTAASAVGLMVGYSGTTNVVHTTPATPRNNFLNGPLGIGLADTSATLPTAPTLQTVLDAGLTGAITTEPTSPQGLVDLEGSIIVPAGGFIAFFTSTASGASGAWFSMQWEEVPL